MDTLAFIGIACIVAAVVAHIGLSFAQREHMREALDDMRQSLDYIAYTPLDDDAPDMIALLGDAYAPQPFTGARDMTGDELAELIESKGAYDPYAQHAARDPLGR